MLLNEFTEALRGLEEMEDTDEAEELFSDLSGYMTFHVADGGVAARSGRLLLFSADAGSDMIKLGLNGEEQKASRLLGMLDDESEHFRSCMLTGAVVKAFQAATGVSVDIFGGEPSVELGEVWGGFWVHVFGEDCSVSVSVEADGSGFSCPRDDQAVDFIAGTLLITFRELLEDRIAGAEKALDDARTVLEVFHEKKLIKKRINHASE